MNIQQRHNCKSATWRQLLARVLLLCYVWLAVIGGAFHQHSGSSGRAVGQRVSQASSLLVEGNASALSIVSSAEKADTDHCFYCDWLSVPGTLTSSPPTLLLSVSLTDSPPVFIASMPLSVLR